MKKLIATAMLLCSGMLAAQNLSSENASHVIDSIFDKYLALIPESQYYTGFVYDKTEKMSALNPGSGSTYKGTYKSWLDVYDELYRSQMTNTPRLLTKKATTLFTDVYDGYQRNGIGTLTAPIGIINLQFNELQPNIVDSGRVGFDGEHITLTNPDDNLFDTKNVLYAAPLTAVVYNGQPYHLYFGEDFYFSNVAGQLWSDISSIHYNYNKTGWITTAKNVDFELSPSLDLEDDQLELEISFTNGKSLRIAILVPKTTFDQDIAKGGSIGGSITGWEYLAEYQFDRKEPIYDSNGHQVAEVGMLFGCGNTSKRLHKPVLFVGGYQPFNSAIPVEAYMKFNNDQFMEKLMADEFDVCILKFENSARKVVDLSPILEQVINFINNEKMNEGYYYENVIMGYSLGALVAKFTLAKMEKQYLSGNGPFHHTRMYVSNDGEHQGANLSVGIIHALRSIQNYNGFLGLCDNILNGLENVSIAYGGDQFYGSDVAKETFIYYPTQTGSSSNPGQGYHPYRAQALLNYQSTDHAYTFKSGYPAFTRNVGVSKGYSDGSGISSELTTGQELEGFNHDWNLFLVHWKQDFHIRTSGPNSNVFRRKKEFKLPFGSWHTIVDENFVMNGNAQNLENVPGSFLGVEAPVLTFLNICTLGGDDNRFKGQMGYVPTVSALDLDVEFFDQLMSGGWDIFKIAPNTHSPNQDYGYPHHTFPNHAKTPFDAIYSQNHWSPKTADGYSDHTPAKERSEMVDFVLNEITPSTLYLQSRTIGNPIQNYTAWFAAREEIVAGSQVTETAPHGNFVIAPTATVRMYAQSFQGFTLANGTDIQAGSDFATVYHQMPDKQQCIDEGKSITSGANSESGNSDPQTQIPASLAQNEGSAIEFKVYPNPVTRGQKITWNVADVISVAVYSMDGRKVYESENEPQNRSLTLDFSTGAYLVYFTMSTQEIKKVKLCIDGY